MFTFQIVAESSLAVGGGVESVAAGPVAHMQVQHARAGVENRGRGLRQLRGGERNRGVVGAGFVRAVRGGRD